MTGCATRRLALLSVPLALTACATPRPAPPLPIAGMWKTGCMRFGENGRHGIITTLTITRRTLTATSQLHAHEDCDVPTIRTTFRATIAAIDLQRGAIDLDHVVDAIEMRLDAPDVVDIYNRPGSGCGFGGGWRRGVPRAVAGRTCVPFRFPVAGARLYERIWTDGGLRFGSFPTVWTNTSPALRPAAPGGPVFTRVSG